ncbi:MAG: hypothetical protein HFF90_01750 [Oscillibacter sp.]|nr:hypothetical protein [Oscillibacter sp.]
MIQDQIYAELLTLGITKRYCGCVQTCLAIELAIEDEERLQSVTEQIYEAVAKRCSAKAANVERNIRTACQRAWRVNRKHLSDLAGYPLYAPPAASDFISIIAAHLQRSRKTLSV